MTKTTAPLHHLGTPSDRPEGFERDGHAVGRGRSPMIHASGVAGLLGGVLWMIGTVLHALEPRVVLMNNGIRKGGQPEAMRVFHSAPGVEDIWQLHFSQLSGQEYTVPSLFIANLVDEQPADMAIAPMTPPARGAGGPAPVPPPVHNGSAFWFKVSGKDDGSFTVTNARNGFSKTYPKR